MEAMASTRFNGRPMSGHVFVVDRQRGPQWYVTHRRPDGRQAQKRLGPGMDRSRAPARRLPDAPLGTRHARRSRKSWHFVRAAADEQHAAIYLTAAFTGLRIGELVGLRWRDVDVIESAIRVRQTYLLGSVFVHNGRLRCVRRQGRRVLDDSAYRPSTDAAKRLDIELPAQPGVFSAEFCFTITCRPIRGVRG
jgi:integrase